MFFLYFYPASSRVFRCTRPPAPRCRGSIASFDDLYLHTGRANCSQQTSILLPLGNPVPDDTRTWALKAEPRYEVHAKLPAGATWRPDPPLYTLDQKSRASNKMATARIRKALKPAIYIQGHYRVTFSRPGCQLLMYTGTRYSAS